MKVTLIAVLSLACLGVVGTQVVAAPEQTRPGEISPANVWVQNRSAGEAIPVVLVNPGQPLQVQVVGAAAGGGTVMTRAARQPWEYSQVRIGPNQDAVAMLNQAGADGWEATGIQFGTTTQAGSTVLLKRPRP